MKTLQFIYQENAIHFLVNPLDKNVMINATEMAKAFSKRVEDFKRLEGTSIFINALLKSENSKFEHADVREQLTEKDVIYGTNKATFMHRKLALKFAIWLDVEFEMWVIDTIDEIIFGNYKKHWDAHAEQEVAKVSMEKIKKEILTNPTPESVTKYFEYERDFNNAKNEKSKAIRNQLKLFSFEL